MMTPEEHGVLIYSAKGPGTLNLGQGVRINGSSEEVGGSIGVIGEHSYVEMNISEHGEGVGVHGKGRVSRRSMQRWNGEKGTRLRISTKGSEARNDATSALK